MIGSIKSNETFSRCFDESFTRSCVRRTKFERRISKKTCPVQGDQIGQIFANWGIVYLGSFFNIIEIAHIFGLFNSTVKVIH
jgi:hypothetical protein